MPSRILLTLHTDLCLLTLAKLIKRPGLTYLHTARSAPSSQSKVYQQVSTPSLPRPPAIDCQPGCQGNPTTRRPGAASSTLAHLVHLPLVGQPASREAMWMRIDRCFSPHMFTHASGRMPATAHWHPQRTHVSKTEKRAFRNSCEGSEAGQASTGAKWLSSVGMLLQARANAGPARLQFSGGNGCWGHNSGAPTSTSAAATCLDMAVNPAMLRTARKGYQYLTFGRAALKLACEAVACLVGHADPVGARDLACCWHWFADAVHVGHTLRRNSMHGEDQGQPLDHMQPSSIRHVSRLCAMAATRLLTP